VRLDAVALIGQGGLVAELLRIVDLHLHVRAAAGLQLPQHRQQVQPRLHVGFGHHGADEGLDLHGTIDLQVANQFHRLRRERVEVLAAHVDP